MTNSPRFDVYTLVHKGQRKRLFELTLRAGRVAPNEIAERLALRQDLEAFLATMEEHAEHEDRFLGPLHREAGVASAERLAREHRALEDDLASLRTAAQASVAEGDAAADLALYRALARFTASYLAHVDFEEAAQAELWARFDDERLAAVQAQLVAAHRPETVRHNLRQMLPAASSIERVRFLVGMKRNLPEGAFAGVRASVDGLVSEEEWRRIEAA